MSSTVILGQDRLAIFGGLTQDLSTAEFKVTNEVIFLNLKTGQWQKPSSVFVETIEDMPSGRMGASMVNYNNKLWVYSGADPYGSGVVFQDFFSFNMETGMWKKENAFLELK